MKLLDLYSRVVETTGLDVLTVNSLKAAVANCMADLTSRGYRTFTEVNKDSVTYSESVGMLHFLAPKDIRKILYCRLYFPKGAVLAKRYSLSNKRVQCHYNNGEFRSEVEPNEAIFYVKGDEIYIEWGNSLGAPENFALGYYQRLVAPKIDASDDDDFEALKNVEINIREEFEDALVLYTAYFYYSRYMKDTEKIQFYLSNYKYYVEDITHELAYEDEFFEEDAVIREES